MRVRTIACILLAALPAAAQWRDKAQRAAELVAAGRAAEAIPLYEEIARAFPNDAGARLNLAVAYFKARNYPETIAQAQAALRLRPDLAPAQLFLGAGYFELGDYSRAAEPLAAAVRALPGDRNGRVMLAETLSALDRHGDAVAHFRTAAELSPGNPRVLYGLADAYAALSRKMGLELERTAPESSYSSLARGDEYLRQRRYGLALEAYRAASKLVPWAAGLRAGLSALYRQTGHAAWAAELETLPQPDCRTPRPECDFLAGRFRQLADTTPQNPEALYWAAKAYQELARQTYAELAQHASSLEYRLHAAGERDSAGLYAEAIREWRSALEIAPEDRRARTGLVWSLYRSRDYSAALELLGKLPGSAEVEFLRGACLLNLEQPEKAVPPLEAALRANPQFVPARAALGHALLRIGRAEEAIPHLKVALAADEDGSVHYQLQRAYLAAGHPELAARAQADYRHFVAQVEQRKRSEEGYRIDRVPIPAR